MHPVHASVRSIPVEPVSRHCPPPVAGGRPRHVRGASVGQAQVAATERTGELDALVAALCARDEAALGLLYDATFAKVHALASAILRCAEDAEEVVCDTYAQAWHDADRYDRSRGNVLAWLLTICRSRALDRLRQRRTPAVELDAAADLADESPAPDDLLALVQQGTRVHAALATLSPERRELIALAFLQGLSHQEIAERTGLPLGTVKSHVRRALAQLREEMEE